MSQGISMAEPRHDPPHGVGADPASDALGRVAGAVRRWLDAVLSHLGAALLTGIILVVLGGVVSRYVFNASFSWTEEGGLWLFTFLIFTVLPLGRPLRVASLSVTVSTARKSLSVPTMRIHTR